MMKTDAFAKDIIGVEGRSVLITAITGEEGIVEIIQVEIVVGLRHLNLDSSAAVESIMTDSRASRDAGLVRPRFADLERRIV